MSKFLKKVMPGDPLKIPANTFNSFIDAAADYQKRANYQGRSPATRQPANYDNIVSVRNDSGTDRSRFDILGINGLVFDANDNLARFKNASVILKGITPAEPTHVGKFVVLQEPIKKGKIGRAAIRGMTAVKVTMAAESDLTADIYAGWLSSLKSGSSGSAQIIWKETGTGLKWALVNLGASVAAAADTTLKVYRVIDQQSDSPGYYTCRLQQWQAGQWVDQGYTNATCRVVLETTDHAFSVNDLLIALSAPDENEVIPAIPMYYAFVR